MNLLLVLPATPHLGRQTSPTSSLLLTKNIRLVLSSRQLPLSPGSVSRYRFEQSRPKMTSCRRPASLPSTLGPSPSQGGHLFHDRRQYPRVVPTAPLLVHVGEYTGLLSNLCEGGLAVNSRFP